MKINTQSQEEISIYDSVNKYDFLLVPTANAIAGAVGFGLPGALAGMAIGMADEVLVSCDWTSGRYLSPMFQGVSSFATLTTSWFVMGAGGTLSFAFSQLVTSEYSEYGYKITYPVKTTLQAGYVFGWKGMVGGIALGGIEEVLIHYEIYNKHYISTAVSYASIAHLVKEKTGSFIVDYIKESKLNAIFSPLQKIGQTMPYFLESISVLISSILSSYGSEEPNITVLEFQEEMRKIYKKLGQEQIYLDILEKQVLTTSGFLVAGQFVKYKLMGCFQKSNGAFYGDLTDSKIWRNFKLSAKEIFAILPILILIKQSFVNPIESYFKFRFQNLLYEGVSKKWLVGETPLKILQTADTEVLIDNLNKDIAMLADSGEELRKSYFNVVIKSSYSQYLMYEYNAQDLIIIYQIYYGCTQYISTALSKWQTSYNEEIRTLESKKNTIIKHDARNVETVVSRDGFSYSAAVLKELEEKIKITTTKQLMIKHFRKTVEDIEEYTDILFSMFLIGYKTHIGELNPDVSLKVWVAAGSIASLMGWTGKNAGTIEEVKNSLGKLHSFINKTEYVETQGLQQVENTNKEMALEDFRLSIGTKELFYVQAMSLKVGMYYALTGDSGSGKSSLLSKIKGITHNGITATGVIKYPHASDKTEEIVFMPQSDFFPIDTTLLEAIYYPKRISLDQKEELYTKVSAMLERLELCSGDSEAEKNCNIEEFMSTRKDWSNVLSGGQKKKVLLVSALIQEPKVLLLDEPFTGLHQEAITKMQFLIKEQLKADTLVICVDHHAFDSEGFYDFELHIENKQLELKEFQLNENILYTRELVEQENIHQVSADYGRCQVSEKYFFNDMCPIEEYL